MKKCRGTFSWVRRHFTSDVFLQVHELVKLSTGWVTSGDMPRNRALRSCGRCKCGAGWRWTPTSLRFPNVLTDGQRASRRFRPFCRISFPTGS